MKRIALAAVLVLALGAAHAQTTLPNSNQTPVSGGTQMPNANRTPEGSGNLPNGDGTIAPTGTIAPNGTATVGSTPPVQVPRPTTCLPNAVGTCPAPNPSCPAVPQTQPQPGCPLPGTAP